MSCTSSDIDKNTCKDSKKNPDKTRSWLHSQDTQCLYALEEVEPKKNDKIQTAKKVTKLSPDPDRQG